MSTDTEHGQLRIISHNVHKGLSTGNRVVITPSLREALHEQNAQLVLLQEIVGENSRFQSRFAEWPSEAQYIYLKSKDLCHSCYGMNARYGHGHHGNAILSTLPFLSEINIDISFNKLSHRGFLYVQCQPPQSKTPLHVICTHFGLVEKERMQQLDALCDYVEKELPPAEPLILAGDFNDWRQKLTPRFAKRLQLKEAFKEFYGQHARSFPAWLPVSRLDRIYYRNLELKSCRRLNGKPWSRLSDHIPLMADFNFI